MANSVENKWKSVCDRVVSYSDVDDVQFGALMERVVPQALGDGFILITADNAFLKNWIEKNFLNHIKKAAQDIYGVPFTVVIEIDEEQDSKNTTQETSESANGLKEFNSSQGHAPTPTTNNPSQVINNVVENPVGESIKETPQQENQIVSVVNKPKESNISRNSGSAFKTLTFENFVRGDSNSMAYSLAVQVAEIPGQQSALNPLFIYGKSGLGKTHLLRAIQNYINVTQTDLVTVYEDTDNFVNEYVNATIDHTREKNSYQTFIRKYENADVLLIDDVQFLQNKEGTIDIIFQIFNRLVSQGKQIVLSADRAPKNIDIDERYTSRFDQGMTIDIKPPEIETKLAIVKSFINEHKKADPDANISVPEDIQTYIAENSGSNIRELKSAVTHLVMHMKYLNQPDITLNEAKGLLDNHFSKGVSHNLAIEDIQKEVETFYRVKHSDLVGQSRARDVVMPRQIAMYLCRQLLDDPLETIGIKFNRDHSTVMHSVSKVERDILTNRNIQEELEAIKKKINEL